MKGDTGKIRYKFRASQQIDFTGVRFGNATPSNVDGLLEIKDELFILLEYKHESAAEMSRGQRLLIERVADQLGATGKTSCAIIAEHSNPVSMDINGARAKVLEVRWQGRWFDMRGKNRTVESCVNGVYNYTFTEPF